jgi:hypothetical protein
MAEPLTTVGLGAIAAYLGKDGLQKLLGPTADYLGQGLRDFTKRRIEKIGEIFQNAESKLGDRIDVKGEVPPKVLKKILDEGSFSNDALSVEYFGGILASSRTESGRDDRGARLAKILDGLSSYQIRTHYLVYSTIKSLFSFNKELRFDIEGRPKMKFFMPYDGYFSAMEFSGQEYSQVGQLLSHTFFGLSDEALIANSWRYGQPEHLKDLFPAAPAGGIVCEPSALGAELFLWAAGHPDKPYEFILDDTFSLAIEGVPSCVQNACGVTSSGIRPVPGSV